VVLLKPNWGDRRIAVIGGKPRSVMMARMYRACFTVATAARNSASVELVAVMD